MEIKFLYSQFFTKEDYWIEKNDQIKEFIVSNSKGSTTFLDPFFGDGDLLDALVRNNLVNNYSNFMGYDIDNLIVNNFDNVFYNDSLNKIIIPEDREVFLITNPPYLARVSAKRKKYPSDLMKHYSNLENDLYKVAMSKMIETGRPGLAIVPESFINSNYFLKVSSFINSITIIIPNPFKDTSVPICVVCFNGKNLNHNADFYMNNDYVYDFNKFKEFKNKLKPARSNGIIFNDIDGQISLKAVDSTSIKDISFCKAEKFNYKKEKIKISSRMMTYIKLSDENLNNNIGKIVDNANKILEDLRKESADIIFTPFKGNGIYKNENTRRRRLDYGSARAILEQSIELTKKYENKWPKFKQ